MSIFANGEEVICVDITNGAEGILVQGKTYIVLQQGKFCRCCIDVGVRFFCYQERFRRPEVNEAPSTTDEFVNVDD